MAQSEFERKIADKNEKWADQDLQCIEGDKNTQIGSKEEVSALIGSFFEWYNKTSRGEQHKSLCEQLLN